MLPVIAIVGRPNVGKSTLFNYLTKSRHALVANMPGLTRDRIYGEGQMGSHSYIVIDTGGLTPDEVGMNALVVKQTSAAIQEADIVFFVVDARSGLTLADEIIAKQLRELSKPIKLIVNKIDGLNASVASADFYQLGFNTNYPISATNRQGIDEVIEESLKDFPTDEAIALEQQSIQGIKMAIVGRPNVGKSTLVNRMLGEERVLVFDEPGTTRDSIYIPMERREKRYVIIDTAGVRRRSKVFETIEKFSVVKTLQAIEDSHVVIMLIDAREGVADQDLHLLGFILDAGKALVIAINKWDGMNEDDRQRVKNELDRRLGFVDFAKTHLISALHGTGVGNLFTSVNKAYHSATKKLTTPILTRLLEKAVLTYQPPLVKGKRSKLRYAHAGGHNPPIIVIHGAKVQSLPVSYQRYLANFYRKELNLVGTPVHIQLKNSA